MLEIQVGQAPKSQIPEMKRLGATALVFGIIASSVTTLTILLSLLSITASDPGWMMVTAIVVMPVGGLVSFIFGAVAVLLAVVLMVRTQRRNRQWIPALVFGLLAAILIPGFFFIVTLFVLQ